LIKSHIKAEGRGKWQTDRNDYPQAALKFLGKTREGYEEEARKIGESAYEFMRLIFSKESKQKLRKAGGIMRLGEKYGHERLEKACQKALIFGNYNYKSLKECLAKNLEEEGLGEENKEVIIVANENNAYLRPASEYAGSEEVYYG
jgi:hypothetical protein